MEQLGSFSNHYSLFPARVLAPLKALAVFSNFPTQSQTTVPRKKDKGEKNQCAKSLPGSVAAPHSFPLLTKEQLSSSAFRTSGGAHL